MGEVYRARDPRLDREVAIKVLSPQLAADPDALARFEREAMSVAKLSHPNILSIFEFARDGGTAFVVTELVDGETLRARLERGALPPRRAVAYALQIAKGIAAAHARGIVHRDLKPENVMITRDDQVKILDFGLAKSIDIGEPRHDARPGRWPPVPAWSWARSATWRPSRCAACRSIIAPTCSRSARSSTRCSAASARSREKPPPTR